MLRNFLFGISGLEATYTMEAREQHCIDYIRRVVGSDKVLFFLKPKLLTEFLISKHLYRFFFAPVLPSRCCL